MMLMIDSDDSCGSNIDHSGDHVKCMTCIFIDVGDSYILDDPNVHSYLTYRQVDSNTHVVSQQINEMYVYTEYIYTNKRSKIVVKSY